MSKCTKRLWVSYISEKELRVIYADRLFGCIPSSAEKIANMVATQPRTMYFCDVDALAILQQHNPNLIDQIEAVSKTRTKTWNPFKRWSYSKITMLDRLDKIAVEALIDRSIRWPPSWDLRHCRMSECNLRQWIRWLKSLDGRYPQDMCQDWLGKNL